MLSLLKPKGTYIPGQGFYIVIKSLMQRLPLTVVLIFHIKIFLLLDSGVPAVF